MWLLPFHTSEFGDGTMAGKVPLPQLKGLLVTQWPTPWVPPAERKGNRAVGRNREEVVGSRTGWKLSQSQLELGEFWNVTYTSLKVGSCPPHFSWDNCG